MSAGAWLELIASGLITGGVYALVALGLNLQHGRMRILNIAHGEFLMVGAFLTWPAQSRFGVSPLLMVPVSFALLMALGMVIHRLVFRRLTRTSPNLDIFEARSLMVSFGLMFLVQNFAQLAWGADLRGYDFLSEPVAIGGAQFATNKLLLLAVVPERDTVYLTVLGLAVAAVLVSILVQRRRLGLAMAGIGADEQRAQALGVNTRLVKIGGFALTAAFAGAVGAAMSVRWTYIDPHTVFNPFIGFQTVLIALIGGAATLWGPLIAAVVFSLLAETLRLQMPQLYMMSLGLLLIVCVLYLPGALASLRSATLRKWRDALRRGWREWVRPASGKAKAT